MTALPDPRPLPGVGRDQHHRAAKITVTGIRADACTVHGRSVVARTNDVPGDPVGS